MKGNPFHPVTQALPEKWHLIAGVLMKATGLDAFELTPQMLNEFAASKYTIVADARGGKLIIRLATDQQAAAMVRDELEGN